MSQKYLETITRMLSKAHLIEASKRAWRWIQTYKEILLIILISEILNLTEGSLAPVSCLKDEQNRVSVQVPVIHFLYGKDLPRLSMTTLII